MNTSSTKQITISNQLMLVIFGAMVIAFGFVAFITNTIVDSKVNAFAANMSAQLAANQNNPITVGGGSQSNALGGCTSPADAAATTTDGATSQSNVSPFGSTGRYLLPFGNYSQSNSSTTNVSSTNTYIKDSYNTARNRTTNVLVTNNGNTFTDNRNSGNNNGNTTVNDNSDNSTNVNIQDNGNTTTNDNSDNSTNTNIQDFSNNSTNNSNNNNGNTNVSDNVVVIADIL